MTAQLLYRLATGWSLGRGQLFSPLQVVETGSGAHPSYYPMGAGDSLPVVNRPGREADHSPPTSQGQDHVHLCILHIHCPINLRGVLLN
jgi:hypothetical protein